MKTTNKGRTFRLLRSTCAVMAAAMTAQAAGIAGMQQSALPAAAAITNFSGATVANQGSGTGDAVIRGSAAKVVHDSTLDSDVLQLNGSAFGAGWLQLPECFSAPCRDGFSVSICRIWCLPMPSFCLPAFFSRRYRLFLSCLFSRRTLFPPPLWPLMSFKIQV